MGSTETDVRAIVAAAMTPELAELERQFGEALEAVKAIDRDLLPLREKACTAISSAFVVKNGDTVAAANKQIADLEATKSALLKTADDTRAKMAEIKPAFIEAVVEGVAPVRARAANDIQVAVNAFYEAVSRYNGTSEALQRAGAPRALVVPMRIPTLDHFVKKVAEDLR